jgi:hypothetical protein
MSGVGGVELPSTIRGCLSKVTNSEAGNPCEIAAKRDGAALACMTRRPRKSVLSASVASSTRGEPGFGFPPFTEPVREPSRCFRNENQFGVRYKLPMPDYAPELQRFASEFDSEDKLRKVLADLLGRMGREGVRITHGGTEKGKDLIFYSKGGLGERRLNACVVKNTRISGKVDESSGAKAVLFQAEQAFEESYVNHAGERETVDFVYIFSPHEPSSSAFESIQGRLASKHVEFVCGRRLLDLFAEFWPSFLVFESSVLTSYLSALCKGLEQDTALANLILRNPYLTNSSLSLAEVYVEPEMDCRRTNILLDLSSLTEVAFDQPLSPKRFESDSRRMWSLVELLRHAPFWSDSPSQAATSIETAKLLENVVTEIQEGWKKEFRDWYRENRAKLTRQKKHTRRRGEKQSVNAVARDDLSLQKHNQEFSFHWILPDELRKRFQSTFRSAKLMLEHLEAFVARSRDFFFRQEGATPSSILEDPGFLNYCRLIDTARLLPDAFRKEEQQSTISFAGDVLSHTSASLLITAPAGFGKTSFCRWHALQDAKRILQKEDVVLPVFVPLHVLANSPLATYEDILCGNVAKIRAAGADEAVLQRTDKIRLYLDGLDEIASPERQERLITLVRTTLEQFPSMQVIITAREHVVGPWLGWLPRLSLSELDSSRIEDLTGRWLRDDGNAVKRFKDELLKASQLIPLMRVPLLASVILAIFRKTGTLPPSKIKLYDLFIELLSGGWDVVKEINRGSKFGIHDKVTFLTQLAVDLQYQKRRDATEHDLDRAMEKALPALVLHRSELTREILQDGLLRRLGAEYGFSHLSFQEFLVARDLVDPIGTRAAWVLREFMGGVDWWKEVLGFYIGMAGRAADAEVWLVRNAIDVAKQSKGTARRIGVDARLNLLRSELSVYHPGYRSHFPAEFAIGSKDERLIAQSDEEEIESEDGPARPEGWRRVWQFDPSDYLDFVDPYSDDI